MQILLANDDGIYAPGLAALEHELAKLGDVTVVAPLTEQSGVGHSITYLHPLVTTEAFDGQRKRGWIVEGSPADCVKLGVTQFCPKRPDLIVSGINSGLNAGINVLYSGTVAAAIEGAFFGITSVAVSLEFNAHSDYPAAAKIARQAIAQLVAQPQRGATLYNLNIPQQALSGTPKLRVTTMGVSRYGEEYEKRTDP
ncbi:MAG TPA: 5'/3'-nucleotidase SurE, partial [Pirellulales bacterium]